MSPPEDETPSRKRKNMPDDDQQMLWDLVQQNNQLLQKISREQTSITSIISDLKSTNEKQAKRIEILEEQVEFLTKGGQLNLILQGYPEDEKEDTKKCAQLVVKQLSDVAISYAHRIGRKQPDKPRAILIKMKSIEDKNSVLQNRSKLFDKNKQDNTKFFINQDLTKSERVRMAQLRRKLIEIRNTDPTAKIKGSFIITKGERITIDYQGMEIKRMKQ